MDKGKFLIELHLGEPFRDCLLRVGNVAINDSGKGPMLTLHLSDNTGHVTAKKWKTTDAEKAALMRASIICASGGIEGPGRYEGEMTIESLRLVPETDVREEWFTKPLPANHKEHIARFKQLKTSVTSPYLAALLTAVFEPETNKKFVRAVAAGSRHHAHPGGLLEHSGEVAMLCACVCESLPCLERDLLVTCALLHDIGKLDEMEHGLKSGRFTEAGALVGHVVLGTYRVAVAADTIPGFPPALKHSVMHMILSHHGQPEYGAACRPACAEAFVLAQCDMLSARLFEFAEAKAEAAPGAFSQWVTGSEIKAAYVGDFGLSGASLSAPMSLAANDLTTDPFAEPQVVFTTGTKKLRVLGRVAAGAAERSSDEPEEEREVVPPEAGADYLLRVTGDSMRDVGIVEGDLVFVRDHAAPRNGEIVVAVQPGHGEVIKTYRDRDEAGQKTDPWLQSENAAYAPIPITEETRIQGKVTGLLRDF